MRVVYVIQRYLPASLTGSEVVIATTASVIKEVKGCQVSVISSDTKLIKGLYDPKVERLNKREMLNGIAVRRLQINWFIGSSLYMIMRFFPWLNRVVGGRLQFLAFGPHLMGLEKAIRNEQPDLVHTGPMPLNHVYRVWQITKKLHIPLIITPMMHFGVTMFNNPLIFTILSQVQGVICFTQYEKKKLIEQGIKESNITVIPASFLQESDFTSGSGESFRNHHQIGNVPIVLFLGTKAYDKGALHLLEIWPIVRQAVPGAQLVLAGLPTIAWQKAKDSHNTTGVIDLDYVSGDTKHDLLAACNILCVPSKTESFGIVVPEAWAKGKPVIGGPTGATRELITEGVDGFTINFGDTADLTEKVIRLLKNPTLQEKMGKAGREKARTFTAERIVESTLAVYKKAVKVRIPNDKF